MRITMSKTIGGTCDGQWLIAGTIVDIDEQTARRFIDNGDAEAYPLEVTPEPVPTPKPAAKKRARRKT